MSILTDLFAGGIEGIGGVVDRGIEDVHGSQLQRDTAASAEQMATENEFAAEFQYRGSRTWFDSLVDGICRLPRPIITYGVIYMFVWALAKPLSFATSIVGLGVMPLPMWGLISAVIAFWFGGRFVSKDMATKWPSAQQIMQAAGAIKQMRQQPMTPVQQQDLTEDTASAPTDAALATATPMDPKAYAAQMADTSRPLTNAAIIEWNRRQQSAKSAQ